MSSFVKTTDNSSLLSSSTNGTSQIVGSSGLNNNALGSTNNFPNILTSTGKNNLALGNYNFSGTLIGNYNTALGNYNLGVVSNGATNTSVGYNNLMTNVSGSNNTSIGCGNLNFSTGNFNTCVGISVLKEFVSGDNNCGIGYNSGTNIVGSNNTCLGAYSGTTTNSCSNSTALGYGSAITASSQIMLGAWNAPVVVPNTITVVGSANFSSNLNVSGVCNTIQSADTILPITFTSTPSFSMTSGMVYSLTTSSTALSSLGFTNIPTTPQQTYVFSSVLNPSTANSAWWLKPPTNFLSITPVGGSINTAVPLVGISNCVLPATYTYIFQQITIVNTSTTTTPSFMGFVSVSGY